MLWFQQNVHFEASGLLGELIGFVVGLATLIGAGLFIWKKVIRPTRDRWKDRRRSIKRDVAFNAFKIQWILDNNAKPIFILDDKRRCIWVNDALTDFLQADSSDLMGRGWHRFVQGNDLTRVLNKWNEAYENQSSYSSVSTMMIARKEHKFLVTAEPFIWQGKVRNYLGRLEEIE